MDRIPESCIPLSRKICDSVIWTDKPSWWLKVWIYLLAQASSEYTGELQIGDCFLSLGDIYRGCYLNKDSNVKGVKQVEKVLKWLESNYSISRKKVTLGYIITVTNYEDYRRTENYIERKWEGEQNG